MIWLIRARKAFAAALPLISVSCGAGGTEERAHLDELPRLSYVEQIRIGDVEDPDSGFSRIGSVDVGANGDVYVLESAAREIRVFSSDGQRLRTVGRSGGGPGEFAAPAGFGLLGDTLWVFDVAQRRLSWFGPDGRLLFETPTTTAPIAIEGSAISLQLLPSRPTADGLIESSIMTMGGGPSIPYSAPVVRFDRSGEVVDTLRWETIRPSRPAVQVGGRDLFPPGLSPTPPLARSVASDSTVLTWSDESGQTDGILDITRIQAGGDTVFRTALRYTALPVPEGVLDSLLEAVIAIAPAFGISESEMDRAMRPAVDLPSARPPVRSMHVGRDGTVWIELNTVPAEGTDWLLIAPDGTPRGRLTLPVGTRIGYSTGSTAWVIQLDEVDVPWLVRLRVE